MRSQLTVADVVRVVEELCPPDLAEPWDTTGLLIGDPSRPVSRVMTCLTATPRTVSEAIESGAHLIVVHHPVPFRPLASVTPKDLSGWIVWRLAAHQISLYSPHTAFDSAAEGINATIANLLGLQDTKPIRPSPERPEVGTGRWGRLPEPLPFLEFAQHVKSVFRLKSMQVVGGPSGLVERVAVGCGASGELLPDVHALGCQAFVLGETRYHTCVEAEFRRIGLCLVGHYQSERLGVERLADMLRERLPQLEIWAAMTEADPSRWI